MILLTQAQRDAVRGDYDAGRLEPVEAVAGLYYLPERLIGVFPGLDAYPTGDVVEAAKAHMLAQAATIRWQKCQLMPYGGVTAYADPAVAVVAAKIRVLEENESPAAVNFKLNATTWVQYDLDDLKTYGQAIDAHIQSCFDNEAALATAIVAAPDLEGCQAIDLTGGWPA